MPDLFDLVAKRWKQMFIAALLPVIIVGVVVFLKPRKYLSTATALPASAFATDKASIFNENIQALYTALGSSDDVDRIVGTAGLDTVYLSVTDQLNLLDHYKMKGEDARIKAAKELKANTKVTKSGYGELKVKAWDEDKNMAPQLANAVLNKLESIHRALQAYGNQATLDALNKARSKLGVEVDSGGPTMSNAFLVSRMEEYQKLVGQYQLLVDSKPPSLITVEQARVADKPDTPKRMQIMIVTLVLSILFSILVALVMERKSLAR